MLCFRAFAFRFVSSSFKAIESANCRTFDGIGRLPKGVLGASSGGFSDRERIVRKSDLHCTGGGYPQKHIGRLLCGRPALADVIISSVFVRNSRAVKTVSGQGCVEISLRILS
jgi:hypothetical protein